MFHATNPVMRKVIQFTMAVALFPSWIKAQGDSNFLARPRHTISVTTLENRIVGGILTRTNDSAVFVYQGKFRQWNQQATIPTAAISYSTINKIQTKKRRGILKGILIGAGIGILPVFIDAIVTSKGGRPNAEGGAYISIVAVPLGTSIGALVGATSKRRFSIEGQHTKFQRFRKKIKI